MLDAACWCEACDTGRGDPSASSGWIHGGVRRIPLRLSILLSILAPPNGCSKCRSSIRRINASSSGDTGVAWSDGSARQLQELALPDNWPCMGSVDHRFALSHPALVSAPAKKSCSGVSCPIVAWSILRSGSAALARGVPPNTAAADAVNCCFHSESVRVHLKVLRQLRQCLVALNRGHGHLGLESWGVIPSRPSRCACSSVGRALHGLG